MGRALGCEQGLEATSSEQKIERKTTFNSTALLLFKTMESKLHTEAETLSITFSNRNH